MDAAEGGEQVVVNKRVFSVFRDGQAIGGLQGGAGGGGARILLYDAGPELGNGIGGGDVRKRATWVEQHIQLHKQLHTGTKPAF